MHFEQFAFGKCQHAKPSGPSHALLLDWDLAHAPLEEVSVDLIGPWPTTMPHGVVKFFALTCLDTTTNLVEIAQIFENLTTI